MSAPSQSLKEALKETNEKFELLRATIKLDPETIIIREKSETKENGLVISSSIQEKAITRGEKVDATLVLTQAKIGFQMKVTDSTTQNVIKDEYFGSLDSALNGASEFIKSKFWRLRV